MTKGGHREGAGRPKEPTRRVSLTVRVKETTKAVIKDRKLKVGPIVDKIVEELE